MSKANCISVSGKMKCVFTVQRCHFTHLSPIPLVHQLSAASKTKAGSVKYTVDRLDKTGGPHLGISAAWRDKPMWLGG